MPIIIKEIYVKTTVEKNPHGNQLTKEAVAAIKRSIVREVKASTDRTDKKTGKDR